jgi:hypothetical protein
MAPLKKLTNKDTIFRAKDWTGREVVLDRQTYNSHIARFHIDDALAVDRVKQSFASPTYVVECRGAQSENAIYQLQVGGHPWLVVAIKTRWMGIKKVRLISTWYSISNEQLQQELQKGRLLWPPKKK